MEGFGFNEKGFGSSASFVPWSQVRAVAIRTTADGPFVEDVFWVFLLEDGRVLELPGSVVSDATLAALQAALPGFDNAKTMRAMGSTEERVFRVWHRDAERTSWNRERARLRFYELVRSLGGNPFSAEAVFARLVAAWDEPHRRYHDLEHLSECLHLVDVALRTAAASDVELALWFHDAVYVPGATDNEERSARLLLEECQRLEIPEETRLEAAALVRATAPRGPKVALSPKAALVVDIDYAVLGADPLRFMDDEYGIEEELAPAVGTARLRIGRARFLAEVLKRSEIFETSFCRQRFEAHARENLAALLGSARYRWARILSWPLRNGPIWGAPILVLGLAALTYRVPLTPGQPLWWLDPYLLCGTVGLAAGLFDLKNFCAYAVIGGAHLEARFAIHVFEVSLDKAPGDWPALVDLAARLCYAAPIGMLALWLLRRARQAAPASWRRRITLLLAAPVIAILGAGPIPFDFGWRTGTGAALALSCAGGLVLKNRRARVGAALRPHDG